MRRQDLSRNADFEPRQLFADIDRSNNGAISCGELYDFMSKQYLSPRMSDCDDIIREYDGSGDGRLNYDEFCQLVLPSTNSALRQMASERRYSPYFRPSAPIPHVVLSQLAQILDKEMQLQRARTDCKVQLSREDFVKVRVFDTIARGYSAIQVPDLIFYLEKNSFYPRAEDIEAILRRCDHDANRQISYSEFLESTSLDGVPPSQSNGPREELKADIKVEDAEKEEQEEINDRVVEEEDEEAKQAASADKGSA